MAQFTWFGGTGDLGNPYNWTNQPDPNNPVVPGPGDDIDISGTGTLTGTDTVSYAELSGNIDLEELLLPPILPAAMASLMFRGASSFKTVVRSPPPSI